MAEVLIVIPPRPELEPDLYIEVLQPKFPQHTIRVVQSQEEVNQLIPTAEVVASYPHFMNNESIGKAKNLRWLHNFITGWDWVNRLETLSPDVIVTRTRIHAPQMSEMALLHMIAISRNLPGFLRNQQKHVWERWPGQLLTDKTVAIVGMGAIGSALARKLKGLDMTVIAVSETPRDIPGVDRFEPRDRLVEIAPELDYLTVIVPLSESTRGLINADVFNAMKPSAFLINVARGGVVDEEAMIKALNEGRIAGAGLDVFSVEPLPADHVLWDMENVIITPHCGGSALGNTRKNAELLEKNLRAYTDNKLDDLIDRVR